jgi:hypothetical protein
MFRTGLYSVSTNNALEYSNRLQLEPVTVEIPQVVAEQLHIQIHCSVPYSVLRFDIFLKIQLLPLWLAKEMTQNNGCNGTTMRLGRQAAT